MNDETTKSDSTAARRSPLRVLLIDASREYMALIRHYLAAELPDVEVTEYDAEQQGRPGPDFDWPLYDCLLIDYKLGRGEDGLDWLREFRVKRGFPPAIMLTGEGNEYVAVKAVRLGVYDYVRKQDISPRRLVDLVTAAVRKRSSNTLDLDARTTTLVSDKLILERVNTRGEDGVHEHVSYRFVRLIGQGQHSRVYLAERRRDRLTIVLKVIKLDRINDNTVLQRFIREAEMMSALDSPFVVRIYDHGFTEAYGFIAMEFFARGDLKQRIERGVRPGDALLYLQHIAHGLQAVHAAGIVHRDLKPGNIMFRSDDSVVLADFGIAKRLETLNELTAIGSILGTPNYISPEQGQGHPVDARSDLYSAGVVLFELLTGHKPYSADSPAGLIYQHVHADIPPLPDALSCYQPLIDRMLAKAPEERYQSAAELIAALEHLAQTPA